MAIDLGKYTEKQLQAMEIRELEALAEAWTRALSKSPTETEIAAIRMANRIFVTRREDLRSAAPALLAACKAALFFLERAGYSNLVIEGDLATAIRKAEGRA